MLDLHSPLLPPSAIRAADGGAPELALPLLSNRVTCGFPSPAEDFYGDNDALDLNQHCIFNPVSTFFMRADTGVSMINFGIYPDDTLIVDRRITPRHGHIVIAIWDNGFTCKQLQRRGRRFELHSGHPDYPPILVPPDMELEIWGVVTWNFRQLLGRKR